MLTPAEEQGLGGLGLAGRVRKAFYSLPGSRLCELMAQVRAEARRRHLVYQREGNVETIHVMPLPLTVLPDQVAYVHSVSLTIFRALKALPEMYMQDFAVRDILKVPPEEEEWIWKCWGKSQQENDPVFGRLDALVDFTRPTWKQSLRFVEPNLSGIGGLHLVPTAERILAELVVPLLREKDAQLQLEVGQDMRDLLMQEVIDHLQAIGRTPRVICFVEPTDDGTGTDEQDALARHFHDRFGLTVLHKDPRELELDGSEVRCGGVAIDLAYRDYSVNDLVRLAKEGGDAGPMRALFQQNRMISSISAELDQKSCWEVLTDPAIAQRYYSADERQVFRRHILWTRIVSDRKTTLPDGQVGDLLEFCRKDHEYLVLKPNRSYGGQGVLLGHSMTRNDWDRAVDVALADPERWVVQQLASIPVYEFPVLDEAGEIHPEPFHTVMGFAATKDGVSTLGRASQKQVVNVALRGGICGVLHGRVPLGLRGPGVG